MVTTTTAATTANAPLQTTTSLHCRFAPQRPQEARIS